MTSRPMFALFGHHKCATMSLNTITGSVCRRLGLTHAAVFDSGMFQGNLPGYCAQQDVDFLLYGNANYQHVKSLPEHLGFHIIRDPRDIVVSAYFSHLYSHPTDAWPELEPHRKALQSLNEEDGLSKEIQFREKSFQHMTNWNYNQPGVLEIRFESFVERSYETLLSVFLHLGLINEDAPGYGTLFGSVLRNALASARQKTGSPLLRFRAGKRIHATELLSLVWKYRFEARTKGRGKGQEDVKNHYRKGRAGDWSHYFTPRLKDEFKKRYPGLVPDLGYEISDNW